MPQLPPVKSNGRYVFEARCWNSVITKIYRLTKNFRQNPNDPLIGILAEARRGYCSDTSAHLLQSRVVRLQVTGQFDGLSSSPTVLFPRVFQVKRLNSIRLEQLPGEVHMYQSDDSRTLPEHMHFLSALDSRASTQLALKPDAEVLVTKNMHPLVNGTRASVVECKDGTR